MRGSTGGRYAGLHWIIKEAHMYVVALHKIVNAENAFTRGQKLMTNDGAPAGVRVLQFYPGRDRTAVTCLWEAPSVNLVQKYVDATLGDAAENTTFEVDSDAAFARLPLGIREAAATTV